VNHVFLDDRYRRISIKSGKDAVGLRVNWPAEDISESLSTSGRSSYYNGRFKENPPCQAFLHVFSTALTDPVP
jgi:hypothetical protein